MAVKRIEELTDSSAVAANTELPVVLNGESVAKKATIDYVDDHISQSTKTLTNKTLTTPTIGDMTNAAHDHSDAAGGGVVPASSIEVDELGTATYDDIQSLLSGTSSAGVISGGEITDSGSGEIDISAVLGVIKTTDSAVGDNKTFDLAGATNQSLTDNSVNYVAVDYNSGTPQFVIGTTSTANGHTIFNLGKVYREGTNLDIITSGLHIADFQKRVQQHHVEEAALHFVSGAVVGETGTRNVSMTAGVMYAGFNRIATNSIDTSGADTFEYYYYNGAAWVESDESQIDNLQYNNVASGLSTLSNNQYGVHWVYKGTSSTSYVLYGQDSYTLIEAQAAQPPSSLPDHVSGFGVLRAKIIISKSASSFTEIESVDDTQFVSSTPSNHNELSNIQGGGADDYQHLTTSELDDVQALGTASTKGVTGDDSNAVTGTAGAENKPAKWNADGDLVEGESLPTTIILSAAGGLPSTTNGCADPVQVEHGTNDVDVCVADFDKDTDEFMQWSSMLPSNYSGTVTAKFVWLGDNSSTDSVVWGLQARAFGDSDAIDQAFGTAQTVTDANNAQNDVNISASTAAITIGGTPAANKMVQFRAYRDANSGSDDFAFDARLLMVEITYSPT